MAREQIASDKILPTAQALGLPDLIRLHDHGDGTATLAFHCRLSWHLVLQVLDLLRRSGSVERH